VCAGQKAVGQPPSRGLLPPPSESTNTRTGRRTLRRAPRHVLGSRDWCACLSDAIFLSRFLSRQAARTIAPATTVSTVHRRLTNAESTKLKGTGRGSIPELAWRDSGIQPVSRFTFEPSLCRMHVHSVTRTLPCWAPYDSVSLTSRSDCSLLSQQQKKKTPWTLVRERTIPTERPLLVDEI
jgi:hypothetical protein